LFASYLSRDKQYPTLLITSKEGKTEWVSPTDVQYLAVGTSEFTCCQRNHIFGDRVVTCDRGITRTILQKMLDAKISHHFQLEQTLRARLYISFSNWWLRANSQLEESYSDSLASFKKLLRWDENEDWKDQNGVSVLLYAVIQNNVNIVQILLDSKSCTKEALNSIYFQDGSIVEFGIPARVQILIFAMMSANVKIVKMLLEKGANPNVADENGVDAIMYASIFGRVNNIKYWLTRYPNWNINRGNKMNGSTALHCAVYFSRCKLQTVKILVDMGANLDVLNSGGASILCNAVDSVDSNVDVVRYLLTKSLRYGVNHRRKARTAKWKLIYGLSRCTFQMRLIRSGILAELASDPGSTSLHYAALRGDVEIVELLMEHGASPSIRNDLGIDVTSCCEAFPEIKGAIKRVIREEHMMHDSTKFSRTESHASKSKPFSLQRRLSTAVPVKYDMYLINIRKIFSLFGDEDDRKKNMHICHQDLKERNDLTRFEDLPMGAFVMFISHQWTGYDHPDPKGVHVKCMASIFRQLRDGKYDVEVDPFHTLLYQEKCRTSREEFAQLFSNAYVWYDFWSQPQPTMAKSSDAVNTSRRDLFRAIESVGAYVERADCLVIISPGTVHNDCFDSRSGRKKYLCFRTFRRRGLCVLEMFAAMCSRRKTHPMLLIQSSNSVPKWLSPLEAQKLAVGESEFSCCERNHENNMSCSRPAVKNIMAYLVDKRVRYLFESEKTFLLSKEKKTESKVTLGRLWMIQKRWFLRGFIENGVEKIDMCDNITGLKKILMWDNVHDGEWFDRDGISVLLYAIAADNTMLVRSLLELVHGVKDKEKQLRCLVSAVPKKGFSKVGITSRMNSLCVAMFMSSPNIVEMLLRSGIDPHNCADAKGIDPFMFACVTAKIDNLRCWLRFVKSWNVNRRNMFNGATALHTAVYLGASKHKLKLVKFLVENCGARVDVVNNAGSTVLSGVVECEDVDPHVLEFILSQPGVDVNRHRKSRTAKWRLIRFVAKVMSKGKGGGLMPLLARGSGATALHHAVMRGDLEIVEKLISAGANPSLKNDLGMDAASMCMNFPELRGLLEKRERKMKLRSTIKKKHVVEVLGKRISTAIPIQHDMWLISLETLLMLYVLSDSSGNCCCCFCFVFVFLSLSLSFSFSYLFCIRHNHTHTHTHTTPHRYGDGGRGKIMEVHQELKKRDFLINWRDVSSDAEIVFVSHEWLSWAHPDPNGEQLRVLCRVLKRLKEGELDTEMDPFHTILYKHKFTTKGKDWKEMLRKTYLWVDWFSMPQSSIVKEEKIGKEKMAVLRKEGSMAIQSIPAYVERSDFIMILVPSLYHSDRKVPTCYRTWRRRGWCLLELYAAVMARDSSNPPLLVRSERGTPSWMCPLEVMKLSIGLADFTCCQRNHVVTTETQKIMSGGSVKKIPCDKPIAGGIFEQLIKAKINHLFDASGDFVMARLYYMLKHWWMRGLNHENKKLIKDENQSVVVKFKKKLRWCKDESWFDSAGVGILAYAVMSDEIHVVRELLQELKRDFKGDEYTRRLESHFRDEGYVALGIPGRTTTLMSAMMLASPEIVSMLLEHGANVDSVDMTGSDALMLASAMGRSKNVQFWIERFKNWDVNRIDTVFGSTALSKAVYFGANKLETVKVLLNAGARLEFRTFSGGSVLTAATTNEDSDPEVVQCLLERLELSKKQMVVNYQMRSSSLKWKSIHFVAKCMYRVGLAKSGLMMYLALEAGTTSLNRAVGRGDVEVVRLLLNSGADPYIQSDLGVNAFKICEKLGPFPSVEKLMLKHVSV